VSGYPDDTLLTAGLARNKEPFLQKPFASEALLRTVRNLLDGTTDPPPHLSSKIHGQSIPPDSSPSP
jgi:hypothetical protein